MAVAPNGARLSQDNDASRRDDLVVYVNRETGDMGIPIFFPHEDSGEPVWCLLPIVGLGERCMWQRGSTKVRSAIRRQHLPAA